MVGDSHPAVAKLDDASGFSSSGCGTDPHQSPIGIKASAGVLAVAPGSFELQKIVGARPMSKGIHVNSMVTRMRAPDCCRLMVWASQGSLHRDGRGPGTINSMV